MNTLRFATALLSLALLSLSGCTKDDDDDRGEGKGQLSGACSPTKIFNGETCEAAVGPVVLLVGANARGEPQYSCTGTYIANDAILTAAHCDPANVGPGIRLFAVTKEFLRDPGPLGTPVSRFVQHPLYNSQRAFGSLDVAIAHLASPVAEAVTLPLLLSEDVTLGQEATLYGFGLTEEQELPVAQGQSTLAPDAGDVEVAEVNPVDIIFGSNDRGSCPGDSGGPAVRSGSRGPGIIGVTSGGFSADCRQATLSPEELPEVLRGRATPAQIADLQRQFPDGLPQDIYVNIQAPQIVDFILREVPDADAI